MQDGAIVHLTEDGMRKCEVPDDHMIILEYQGHYFSLETDNNTIDCALDSAPTL